MSFCMADLAYLVIEVFIVGIEDRPLRNVVAEGCSWSLFNECFPILGENDHRGQREGERWMHGTREGLLYVWDARSL